MYSSEFMSNYFGSFIKNWAACSGVDNLLIFTDFLYFWAIISEKLRLSSMLVDSADSWLILERSSDFKFSTS